MSKLLNKHISILKTEIQDILIKINNGNESVELIELKEVKKQDLKESILKLNEILKEEKELRNKQEVLKINKTVDNLKYQQVKKNPNRNEIVATIKETREKAKDNYDKLMTIEKNYLLIDPPELPGFLFFDKNIINKYTLCPFIKANETDTTETILANRKDFLNNTVDNGKLYYDLYDKIIKKTEIINVKQSYIDIQVYCENVMDESFNDSQKNVYKESLMYLKQYTDSTIKTKKIKELFKILINNISTLVIETKLNIHVYLSLIYNCDIPINEMPNVEISIGIERLFIYESFNEKVNTLKQLKESISSKERFITNTTKNLQLELYEYLNNTPINIIKQTGKYHNKKWNELSIDEKNDRFESFSNFFVESFLISTNLLDISQKNDTIKYLYNMLLQSQSVESIKKIKNKKTLKQPEQEILPEQEKSVIKLKSKDIRWNMKNGIISKISSLQWDDISKKLFFIESETVPDIKVETDYDTDIKIKFKKISSIKTILTKQNEEIINEEILKFILIKRKNNQGEPNEELDRFKIEFVEVLKLKLKLKRITNNDKALINKKFDEIYMIIINN